MHVVLSVLESISTNRAHEKMIQHDPIPVIDLFAGPGGLGDGFSSCVNDHGEHSFAVRLSIEKDQVAHKTLSLRALFRAFPPSSVPDCYYDHVRGDIAREALFAHPDASDAGKQAILEARCAELGITPSLTIDDWIRTALGNATEWVLIGGRPVRPTRWLAGRACAKKMPKRLKVTDATFFTRNICE
jgi:DNA (cytosine-5)-methyltransferase 1